MNKFSLIFTLLFGILISSCQEEDFGYTSYDVAFGKEFGKVSDNHKFGFIDQEILNYDDTRAEVNPNSNQWATDYKLDVPNPVTDAEIKYVTEWFKTHKNPSSEVVHWENFFIQYIYNDKPNMDELIVMDIDGSEQHIYNYNNSTRAMQYVYNAGTESWSYRSTQATDIYNRQWTLYNIQHLTFTGEDGVEYDGWYIGFDYETAKTLTQNYHCNICNENKNFTVKKVTNPDGSSKFTFICETCGNENDKLNKEKEGELKQFEAADGYYSNWIVKVTPGLHKGYPVTVRVMGEDLGSSFDWDFNDIVFDVTFTTKFATIVLRAVGGTIPIYVGTQDENYEAHKLLGDGSMTPIIHSNAPVIYTVDYVDNGNNTANAKNIPIYVNGEKFTYTIQNGKIPQKFACPDYVGWSEEMVNICETYPNFPDWLNYEDMYDAYNVWVINPNK